MSGWMIPATVAGQAANEVLGRGAEKRQDERQKEYMGIQHKNQRNLNKQGSDLQYEMWQKTGYGAQVDMMKDAGLSAGLMYGGSGGSGQTTGSQGGGSATGAQSGSRGNNAPMDIGNALQMGLLKAQKENIEADTVNKQANTGGTNATTKLTGEQINKVFQETQNEEMKGLLILMQTAETEENVKLIKDTRDKIQALTKSQNLQNKMTQETWDSLVEMAGLNVTEKQAGIAEKEIDVELKERTIDSKTRQEENTEIMQRLESRAKAQGINLSKQQQQKLRDDTRQTEKKLKLMGVKITTDVINGVIENLLKGITGGIIKGGGNKIGY